MASAVRDLTFIMSELSTFLTDQNIKSSFLEMIVSLVSSKQMLSNFHPKQEELVTFACQAITSLISPSTEESVLERVAQMLLELESKRARQVLCVGLRDSLKSSGRVRDETLEILVKLNTVKKGTADMDLDLELVLNGQ